MTIPPIYRLVLAAVSISVAPGAASFAIGAVKTGPGIGERIPSFSAPDQNGRTQTLETIAGPKGAMLVFYRSADW